MFDAMYIPRETSGPVPDDLLAVQDLPFHGHKAPYAPFVRSGLSLFVVKKHKQFREDLLKKLADPVNRDVTYAQVHHYAQTNGINLTPHDINELRTHTLPPALTAAYAQAEARAQAKTETRAHAQAQAPAGAAQNGGESARPKPIMRTAAEWAAAIRGLLEKDITDSDKNRRLPAQNVKVDGVPIGARLYNAAARRRVNGDPHTVLSDEEAEALHARKLGGFLVQVDRGWVLDEGADTRRNNKKRTSEEWAAAIRGLSEEDITDIYRNRCLPSEKVKVGEVLIGKHLSDAARRKGDGQPHVLLSDEEAKALRAKDLERFLVKVNGKWALDRKPVQPGAGLSRQAVVPSPARYNTRARAVVPTGNTARPGTETTAPLPQPPIGRHTAVSTSHSHHRMPLTVAAAAGQTSPGTAHPHHSTNQQPSPQTAGLTRNPHTTPNPGLGR
ncbi:hypothetical protein AB0911_36945 [Streptomyces nigra]|uniref:hypothetical protein n=1 Tax=Streptomyces nigra TaxID=1827580 RepID=UPI003454844F